jgi:uroporphyrinogen III methyltransferase/synthase
MADLTGVRIAVTRAATQSKEWAVPLEQAGATVYACPLIRVEPHVVDDAMRRVLAGLDEFDWIVFTSVNGVDQFFRVVAEAGLAPHAAHGRKIACVGPATAAAAERYGMTTQAIPDVFVGDAMAAAILGTGPGTGQKILIARAAGGGPGLPQLLRERGAEVVDLELYRSVIDPEGAARLRELADQGKIDVVTFTSGSAVNYFVQTVDSQKHVTIAVIGPSTAQVARERGLTVDIVADPHTTTGLATAILNYYAARRGTLEV